MENKRFIIVIAVLVVGFFGFVMFGKAGKDSAETTSTATVQGSSNYYGNMGSAVSLTEFVDFQCEACYSYYPYVKQLKEQYKDKVKFQVRYFPITSGHQFAFQAARSAEAAARQDKFWEMHDKLFEGQKTWEQVKDPQQFFDQYAQDIGLNMEKFKADRTSSGVAAVINKDLEDVKKIDASGTPTFVLNGKKIENPGPSFEALSKVVDNALRAKSNTK